MQNVEIDTPPAVFVVVMREALIARDIEMIIRDLRTEARVVLARTPDEATAAVPAGRIAAAFVQMDVGDFVSTELSRRVASDGGRTVLVGLEATTALPVGWSALPFPFSGDDVTSLLTASC
jgi:hypothetical protein